MAYTADFLAYARALSLTLTSLRKAVLYVLWQADKPLKAYDILEYLRGEQPNITAAAIYRILGFFMTAGVVHKIDAIQSYALCNKPDTSACAAACSEIFMVCAVCECVLEAQDITIRNAAAALAVSNAFQLSHDPIALRGVCEACVSH